MLPEAALKAIAHPTRRRMLALVWDSERTSTDLADSTGLTRPATSQHLRVLREAELVVVQSRGNLRLYRANLENLAQLRAFLDDFWGARMESMRESVESET